MLTAVSMVNSLTYDASEGWIGLGQLTRIPVLIRINVRFGLNSRRVVGFWDDLETYRNYDLQYR
jgi:hypothetical protein